MTSTQPRPAPPLSGNTIRRHVVWSAAITALGGLGSAACLRSNAISGYRTGR